MIIYLITNKINGKQYIGQTIQPLKRRWDFHVSRASGCLALKAAIEIYGKENFQIEEIFKAESLEELSKKEQDLISQLNTLAPNGYNLTTGGERPVYSEETRKKMSESSMGRNSWSKGKTKEDPRIAKFVEAGRKAYKEKFGESSPNLGHKWSDEARQKASKRMTGSKMSEQTKKNMSSAQVKTRILCIETGTEYESIMDASRKMNLNSGCIHNVISGRRKSVGGYTFSKVLK